MQRTDRKQGLGQLRLVQAVQEIALILGRIQALEQFEQTALRVLAHPGVVARGDFFGAQAHGMVQKCLELDLGIAQDVGVGRATGLVLAQEFGKYAVLVFRRKVYMLDLDADHVGDGGRIDEINIGCAITRVIPVGPGCAVVVFPILHEDADDFVAGLL